MTKAGKKTGNEAGEEPGNEAGEEPGNEARKESGNEAGEEPGNEAGEEPGNEAGKESGNEAGNEVIRGIMRVNDELGNEDKLSLLGFTSLQLKSVTPTCMYKLTNCW